MSPSRAARARMQRRYPRLTIRVDVVVETLSGPVEAVATTLGAGGLFVASDAPLPPRTPLVVRFRLPGEEESLSFDARVAWSAPPGDGLTTPGMGLEFDDLDARAEHAARLERWAARREQDEPGVGSKR